MEYYLEKWSRGDREYIKVILKGAYFDESSLLSSFFCQWIRVVNLNCRALKGKDSQIMHFEGTVRTDDVDVFYC